MEAVYIESEDLAKRVSRGQVKYIFKTQPFEKYTNHAIYVAGPKYVWGKIFLSSPVLTDNVPQEFRDLYPGARRLYRFKVIVIQQMDPTPYTRPKKRSAFFNITIEDRSIEEYIIEIQDISNYNPADQTKAQRADDWRLLIAHYAKHLTGKSTSWSKKDIEQTALKLARYMAQNDSTVFHPDTMTHAGRELFSKLLELDPELPHSLTDEELSIPYDVVRSLPTRDLYTLHSNLHHTWDRKHDERVANLHDFVLDVLKKRGKLPNCNTYLVKRDKTEGAEELTDEQPAISLPYLIALENAVCLIGSQVYAIANDLIEPNDVDI